MERDISSVSQHSCNLAQPVVRPEVRLGVGRKTSEIGRGCIIGTLVPLRPHTYQPEVDQKIEHPGVLLVHFADCSNFLQLG